MAQATRDLPDDWFTFAPGKSIAQLKERYQASNRLIAKWRKMTGVAHAAAKPPPLRIRPIPDDLDDMCLIKTKRQLAFHYKTGMETINRWLAATGYQAKVYNGQNQLSQMGRNKIAQLAPIRTKSMFDEAADILRRERFVVFRCGPKGQYMQAGDWWRVGNTVCTPDELLQRADRYRSRAA